MPLSLLLDLDRLFEAFDRALPIDLLYALEALLLELAHLGDFLIQSLRLLDLVLHPQFLLIEEVDAAFEFLQVR